MYKEYRETGDAAASGGQFWDEHWGEQGADLARLVEAMERTDPLARFFDRRLPRRGRVLEAGCGVGRYAGYLRRRGHPIEGIDFAAGAVARARASFPEVPFVVGDLERIPAPDASYDAITCLGVIEHFEDGPARILAELRRVLAPGGTLYVSVPYESLSFRWMNVLERRLGRGEPPQGPFYQYRYRRSEFVRLIEDAGFRVRGVSHYGGVVGLKRRLRFVRRLLRRGAASRGVTGAASPAGRVAAPEGAAPERAQPERTAPEPAAPARAARRIPYPLLWLLDTRVPFFAHMVMIAAQRDGR